MPGMAVIVTGLGSPDPYDLLHVDFTVFVEGVSSGWTAGVDVAFDATADQINAAVRAVAVGVAANHSVVVGFADVQRVIGGAMETPL